MKIGYACSPMTLNYRNSRSFMLKNFTYDRFYECVKENLEDLHKILKENLKNDIYFFRISSDIIPFGSHDINNIKWWEIFKNELFSIGNFIKQNNIRVSMHPGQYTVLNSPSEAVVNKSIKDIEYHTKFLDSLNLDYTHKIILHVGGMYGEKEKSINRFKINFKKLSLSAKKRLIIENDEKIYTIEDILGICKDINIPAVFDNLHHKLNLSLDNNLDEILKTVVSTWKKEDGRAKLHYSDEDFFKKKGAHSNFVDTKKFLIYYNKIKKYDVDVMLEVKDKEISAIKCINLLKSMELQENKNKILVKTQLEKYKYLIMERGEEFYKEFMEKFNESYDVIGVYEFIDEVLMESIKKEDFIETFNKVWEILKYRVTKLENNQMLKLINNDLDYKKVKEKLRKLSIKYNVESLEKNYYFYY